MSILIIHSKKVSNRLHYIALQLFEQWHQITINFVEDVHAAPHEYSIFNSQGVLLCSSQSNILFADSMYEDFAFDWDKILANDFNSDWLGASFFLLSRMEEYAGEKDVHGRFSYKKSIAFQQGFLNEPIVERLVHYFVMKNLPQKTTYIHKAHIVPTLDIDMTHAILGRSVIRQCGAILKDFVKAKLSERLQVLRGKVKDPYDTFDYQLAVMKSTKLTAQYFFQVGAYGKYDKNISPKHPLFKKVIAKLHKHNIGLHPSYKSMIRPALFSREKKTLEQLCERQVQASRQHFLRFCLPETYSELIKIGIKEEHSMGYAETIGFRASTSRAFYWYDLKNNCPTELLIQPFVVMDVALAFYQGLAPEKAISAIQELKQKIAEMNGTFAFCFHNESLSERNQWKGWRAVFEEACKS